MKEGEGEGGGSEGGVSGGGAALLLLCCCCCFAYNPAWYSAHNNGHSRVTVPEVERPPIAKKVRRKFNEPALFWKPATSSLTFINAAPYNGGRGRGEEEGG